MALALEHKAPLFLNWASSVGESDVRLGDLFDIEASAGALQAYVQKHGRADVASSFTTHMFQIGKWKCQSRIELCAQTDIAFNSMLEVDMDAQSVDAARSVSSVLQGRIPGKQNVFLRLQGGISTLRKDSLAQALALLKPLMVARRSPVPSRTT